MIIFDPYKGYECTVRLLFHTAELSAQRRNSNDGSPFMLYAGSNNVRSLMKRILNEVRKQVGAHHHSR
jgi:hypothetical protein